MQKAWRGAQTRSAIAQALFFLALVAAFVAGMLSNGPAPLEIPQTITEAEQVPSAVGARGGSSFRGMMLEMPVQ